MKSMRLMSLLTALALWVPASLWGAGPIVSTDWLEKNLTDSKLKILDIRKVEEFREGHIPGAVNVFYGSWAVKVKELNNQLPAADDLGDLIGAAGIRPESLVVVVGKTDNLTEMVNQTRVAWTLKYAGLNQVAVLDGGYNKWVKESRPQTREVLKPSPANFRGKWNQEIVAAKGQSLNPGPKSVVDARMPDFFFGVSKLDFVGKAGHIPGAVSLPSAWIFTKEGTFKSNEELEAMAGGVIGKDKEKEILTYCDTGRLATGWWFVLQEVLGYKKVKVYDGSMEEWGKDPATPVMKYSWN